MIILIMARTIQLRESQSVPGVCTLEENSTIDDRAQFDLPNVINTSNQCNTYKPSAKNVSI